MSGLLLTLLLTWFGIAVFLALWALLIQGYLYNEPSEQIWWGAPAAGAVLTLYLGMWMMLAARAPGRYANLAEFSSTEVLEPYKELTIVNSDGKEETFKMTKTTLGRHRYLRDKKPLPSRPAQVIVTENGERVIFDPERDEAGNFKVYKSRTLFGDVEDGLRYRDARGRQMFEGDLGTVSIPRPGWLVGNLLLNFLLLGVWFLCLWLLVRFQWGHALAQSAVFWLMSLLFLVPPLLQKAEAVATRT